MLFLFLNSNIEDKEQVLELDQLQAKTESAYASLHEKTKPGKSRSGKSKRRSNAEKYTPYQLPTPPVMYSDSTASAGEYSQHRAAAYGQYTACEVPVPAAQYATVPYQEGLDRYNAMYSAGYATGYQPNVYADGAYSYSNSFAYSSAEAYAHCMNERLQYRGHYGDERYYTSDPRYFHWSHDTSRSMLTHGLSSESDARKSTHVQSDTSHCTTTSETGQSDLLLQQCGHSQLSATSPNHSHMTSRSHMSDSRNSYHAQSSPAQTGSPSNTSDISPHGYRGHRQRDGHEPSTSSSNAGVAPHTKFDSLVQATQHLVKEEQQCKKSPQVSGANVVQSDSGFNQASPAATAAAGREQACRQASPAQGDTMPGRTPTSVNSQTLEASEATDSRRSSDYTMTEMRRSGGPVAAYSSTNQTGHGSPSYPVNLTVRNDHLSPDQTGADIPDRPVEAATDALTAVHYGATKDQCYYSDASGKGYLSSFSFTDSMRRGSKDHGFMHTNSAICDRTAMSWYGNSVHHKELANGYAY